MNLNNINHKRIIKRSYIYNWVVACLAVALTLMACSMVQAKTFRIGVVYDGESPQLLTTRDFFATEIQSMARGAHTVHFPADAQLNGNWDVKQINVALNKLMAWEKVDMVLTLGEVAAHEVCRRKGFSKPVFAVNVLDPELQGIPNDKGISGVPNLNYISTLCCIDRDLQLFREITPFSKIAVIGDEFINRSIPELDGLARRLAGDFNIEVAVVSITDSARVGLAQIPPGTDAVLLAPMPRLSHEEFQILADGLMARKLPSFSFRGQRDVETGILASTIAEGNTMHMARRAAVNVREIMDGINAGTLPTEFDSEQKLFINMATARAIHVYPGWGLLTEAELINEEVTGTERRMNINTVMEDALTANLDLAAANQSVEAGIDRVKEVRSALLPQLQVSTQALTVDKDRARAYGGTLPERQWTGTLAASQLIYSDKAWAGFAMEKYRQTSREQGRDAVRLDIMQAAASTYLNLLRVRSIERIQKENLKLTRQNLGRARIRVETGAGGPEEVYRWESEIAGSRRTVLRAQSVTLDVVTSMNSILNRPLSDRFSPKESDYTHPLSILPDQGLTRYMNNPTVLDMLRDFLVAEGIRASPELQQIQASIAAQKRSITLAKRSFWVPTVSLFGDVSEAFSKSGEGSEYPPGRDDTDWSAGVRASIPLFEGGGRSASLNRRRKELAKLRHERDSRVNGIEKRVLKAVHLIRASYPGIGLSNDAANAARLNLTLVTDSYGRGIKSITDLIDAQNQSLVADQQAANAVYDFLIDIIAIQRSTGSFFLFAPEKERDDWMKRLNRHMDSALNR